MVETRNILEQATDFSRFDPEKIVNPDKFKFKETEENLEMHKFEDFFRSMATRNV